MIPFHSLVPPVSPTLIKSIRWWCGSLLRDGDGRVGCRSLLGHDRMRVNIEVCRILTHNHLAPGALVFQRELTSTEAGQPGPDWTRVEAPGWSDQQGFSLLLPPGWALNELQGIDSYGGEVTGDGVRLVFDYGWYSWGLNPEDEPEHEYLVSYEVIGGLRAELLLPVKSPSGATADYPPAIGVYLQDLGGASFNLIGRGLTPDQQRVAVGIFRSVRVLE